MIQIQLHNYLVYNYIYSLILNIKCINSSSKKNNKQKLSELSERQKTNGKGGALSLQKRFKNLSTMMESK